MNVLCRISRHLGSLTMASALLLAAIPGHDAQASPLSPEETIAVE